MMRKGYYGQLLILFVLVLLTSVYLNGTRIFGPPEVNSSYLTNITYQGPENTWHAILFGKRTHWESMQNYVGMLNEYEYQRNYGLIDHAGEARYMKQFSEAAMGALQGWQSFQLKSYGKQLLDGLDQPLGLQAIRRSGSPLLFVGVLAAAYTGKTIRYRLGTENMLETRTNMNSSRFERQYLSLRNTALDFSAGGSIGSDGNHPFSFNLQKRITPEVSVNYERQDDHRIGVSYTKGF